MLNKVKKKIKSHLNYDQISKFRKLRLILSSLDTISPEKYTSCPPGIDFSFEGDISNIAPFYIGTGNGLLKFENGSIHRILPNNIYGITFKNDSVFAFQNIKGKCGRVVKINNSPSHFEIFHHFLDSGCHQIDFIGNKLFIADTNNNRIIIKENKTKYFIYPNGMLKNGRDSSNYSHFNSIFGTTDKIYLLAHNLTSKTKKFGRIYELERSTFDVMNIYKTKAENAHNIAMIDSEFWYCDSMKGTLNIGYETVFMFRNYFSRGLAVNKSHVLIGFSELAQRENRYQTNGFVVVLDRDMKFLAKINIIKSAQICEVRFEEDDLCLSNT